MFTGLVELKGKVVGQGKNGIYHTLFIRPEKRLDDLKKGQSIAVNGVCLTLTEVSNEILRFDMMYQTLSSTNLADLRKGNTVNIERALKASDRLDGHVVSGHVDATLKIIRILNTGRGYDIWFRLPSKYSSLIFEKCSVAIDGVSLTVQKVKKKSNLKEFSVSLIPETLETTSLFEKKVNDNINIEFDTMIKASVNWQKNKESSISLDMLDELGF